MGRLQPLFTVVILAAVCLAVDGTLALASDEDSIQRVLAAGQQAMLERHYRQAVHVLQNGVRNHPQDNRLRLELGRAYLSNREDGRAIRLFREILRVKPDNRLAKLELARALGYSWQYGSSDEIYKKLLMAN